MATQIFLLGQLLIEFQVKVSSSIMSCILVELAEGGSVAVAVGVSDMQQVTGDMRHMTHDT